LDLASDFPPLASLDARPHNLPAHLTALLGREREVQAVRGLLLRDDVRLVTLTGPGGTGKTRLGLEVAAQLLEHVPDGVFFVPLAPISDPDLVLSTLTQVLGLRETPGRSLRETLTEFLKAKHLLLLLDNFEQILLAAPAIADLLAACPRLNVLATSREALHLRGEREYAVPPLACPDPKHSLPVETLAEYAAVSLFMQRASAVRAEFAITEENAPIVAEACRRLDGLPLAIELAAARIKVLPPEALLRRLERRLPLLAGGGRDLPARQQTLRDAIAWSYDLLSPEEQTLFRRLAVFVGGFTLEAAECNCDEATSDQRPGACEAASAAPHLSIFDGVDSLVDKSLLRQEDSSAGEPRFAMLETIREYATERLEACGEAPVLRRRHAEYFLGLAERAEPHFLLANAGGWLNRVQAEYDNLRAALRWCLADDGDTETGVQIAAALSRFWQVRSYLSEGQRWLDLALASSDAAPVSSRPKALIGAGWLAHNQGDPTRAALLFEEATSLSRRLGDWQCLAVAVGDLGAIMEHQGNYERAAALLAESLALYRETGNQEGVAGRLRGLGSVACAQGDFEQAAVLLEESLTLCRQLGATFRIALALGALGLAALYQGDAERALRLFDESLVLHRQLEHTYGIAWSLHYLGRVAQLRGETERATALLSESLTMRRDLGDTAGIAGCLEGLAAVALTYRQAKRSAHLFGAAEFLREAIDAPLSPAERVGHDADLAAARAQADADTFAAAWAEGRAMTLEQAVAYALEEQPPA
jgi:predicted ATPase